MDYDRRMIAAFERMTLDYTGMMYQSYQTAVQQQQTQYDAQIQGLQTQIQQLQEQLHAGPQPQDFDDVNDDSDDDEEIDSGSDHID